MSIREVVMNEDGNLVEIKPDMMEENNLIVMAKAIGDSFNEDTNIVLVFDNAPQMGIWRPSVESFANHLSVLDFPVFLWEITTVEKIGIGDKEQTTCFLHNYGDSQSPPSGYDQLMADYTNTIVFVVTDCCGVVWKNRQMLELIQPMTQQSLVTILQILPQFLWSVSQINHSERKGVSLCSTQKSRKNNDLLPFKQSGSLQNPCMKEVDHVPESPFFPVIPFRTKDMMCWINVVSGKNPPVHNSLPEYYVSSSTFDPHAKINPKRMSALLQALDITRNPKPVTLESVLERFEVNTTSETRHVVKHCAVLPLIPSYMKMVLMDKHKLTHVEFVSVFYSGMFERVTSQTQSNDFTCYDFRFGDEMRRTLLEDIPVRIIDEILTVVELDLVQHIQENFDSNIEHALDNDQFSNQLFSTCLFTNQFLGIFNTEGGRDRYVGFLSTLFSTQLTPEKIHKEKMEYFRMGLD